MYDATLGEDLSQGDVLKRTPELEAILEEYHPVYFRNNTNLYFIVLTQSCDLVRRKGMPCAARYVTLSAVRSLAVTVRREVERYAHTEISQDFPVCTNKDRDKLNLFMQSLLNNNHDEYLYLEAAPELSFPEECCAFLRLSIPIKSLHYNVCLQARLVALNANFRAKLGWLVGQVYARVDTPDRPTSEVGKQTSKSLRGAAQWIAHEDAELLAAEAAKWRTANAGQTLDERTLALLQRALPKRKDQAINRIAEVLLASGALRPDANIDTLKAKLNQDTSLWTLLT